MKKLLQNGLLTALLFAPCVFTAQVPETYTYKCSDCGSSSEQETKPTSCSFCYGWSFEKLKKTSVKKPQAPYNAQVPQNYPPQNAHAASGNQQAYVDKVCSNCNQHSKTKKNHTYCTSCGTHCLTLVKKHQAPNPVHPYNHPNNVQNNSVHKPPYSKPLPSQSSAPSPMQMSSKQMGGLNFSPHPNPASPPQPHIDLQKEMDYIIDFNLFYGQEGENFIVGARKDVQLGTLLHYAIKCWIQNKTNISLPTYYKFNKNGGFQYSTYIAKEDLSKKLSEVFYSQQLIKIKNFNKTHTSGGSHRINLKEDLSKYPTPSISSNRAAYYTASIVLIKGIVQKKV